MVWGSAARWSIVMGVAACGLSITGAESGSSVPDGGTNGDAGGASTEPPDIDPADAQANGDDAMLVEEAGANEAGGKDAGPPIVLSCAGNTCSDGRACCLNNQDAPTCSATCTATGAFVLECTSVSDCARQGGGVCCLTLDPFGVSRARCAATCTNSQQATLCTDADKATTCGPSTTCVSAQCNDNTSLFATCRKGVNNFSNQTCKVFH